MPRPVRPSEPAAVRDPENLPAARPGGAAGAVLRVMLVAIPAAGILFILQVPSRVGVPVFREQYLGVLLALALPAVFLSIPARGRARARVPWYDWVLACAGVAVGGYVAVYYPSVADRLAILTPDKWLLGLAAVVLLLEAVRRTAGPAVLWVAVVFLLYGRFADLLPGPLAGTPARWERLFTYLYLDLNGILGTPLAVASTVVLGFVLMGQVLFATGGADFLGDLALALVGRFRGGPAKMAVVASSLFGNISGSAVANVAVDGPITIPMMKRAGYPAHVAAAVEATASTGGQIMPPVMGAAAFLMAEFLGIRYAEVAAAALIPAILYYVCLFFQVDLEAARAGLRGLPADQLPQLRRVLPRGSVFAVALGSVILGLYGLRWQADHVGVVAAALAALAALALRVRGWSVLGVLEQTGRALLGLVAVTGVAGLVIGVLQYTGLGFRLALLLTQLAGGNLPLLLLLTAVVAMLLGMGMPTVAVYVLMATLVAPALVQLGVPALAAHLFVFYFGMLSMITPPVCLATFTAAAIGGCDFWRAGWASMRLAAVAYLVPFLFALEPALIGRGSMATILLATGTAVLGTWLLAASLVGHWFTHLSLPERVVLATSAVAVLTPETGQVAAFSWPLEVAGLICAALLAVRNWRQARHPQAEVLRPAVPPLPPSP
ncbi:MAG: TRAP transporter fused permease subunit [Firmicutes bacterium]|nr:TRAP transporter fused permease subunit [Bacillota bacterium]